MWSVDKELLPDLDLKLCKKLTQFGGGVVFHDFNLY